MKKNYFEPEIKISNFSSEDVITTSGLTSSEKVSDVAENSPKATLDYGLFNIIF